MPIPITVYVDTGETVLSVAQVGELLTDLSTIFATCALLANEEEPGPEDLDIYLSQAVAGSLWTELLVHPETVTSAKAAGTFVAVLTGTPYLAALPQRIRAQWYRRAAEAEAAKLAYTRVRRKGQLFAAEGRLQDVRGQAGRQRRRSRGGRQTTQQN